MKKPAKRISPVLLGLTAINVTAAIAVLASTNGAFAAPDPPPGTVRAQRIELVDAAGELRGQLHVEQSGEAVFRLRDEKGQIRVKLGASERGSGFILMDDRTEPGVQMLSGVSALTNKRDTHITLANPGGGKHTITPQ